MIKQKFPVLFIVLCVSFFASCSGLFNNEQEDPYRFADKEYYYERGEKVYVERSLEFVYPFLKNVNETNDKRLFMNLVSEYDLEIIRMEDFIEVDLDSLSSLSDSLLIRTSFNEFVLKVPEDENLELFYTNTKSSENFGNNELLEYCTPVYRIVKNNEWMYVGNRLYIDTDPENQIPEEIISKYNLERKYNYVVTKKAFAMKDMITYKPIETVRRIYEENDYENVRPSRLFLFRLLNE